MWHCFLWNRIDFDLLLSKHERGREQGVERSQELEVDFVLGFAELAVPAVEFAQEAEVRVETVLWYVRFALELSEQVCWESFHSEEDSSSGLLVRL